MGQIRLPPPPTNEPIDNSPRLTLPPPPKPAIDNTVNPPGDTSPAPSIHSQTSNNEFDTPPPVHMPDLNKSLKSGIGKTWDWANKSVFNVEDPTPEEIQHEGMPAVIRKGVAGMTTPLSLLGEGAAGLGLLKGAKYLKGVGKVGEAAEEIPKVKEPISPIFDNEQNLRTNPKTGEQFAGDSPKPRTKLMTNRDGTLSPKDNPLMRLDPATLQPVKPKKITLPNIDASLSADIPPTKVNLNSGDIPNVSKPKKNPLVDPPKNETPINSPTIPPENQLGMGFGEDAPADFQKPKGKEPKFDLEDPKFDWDKWNKKPIKDKIVDVLGSARSVQSVDFTSALLRQGVGQITRKPFWTSIKPAFQAMGNEETSQAIARGIMDHPLFGDANKNGVSFTGFKNIASREEQFQSPLAEHIIPKIVDFAKSKGLSEGVANAIPNPIRAAARGYTAFMNKLRMDTYASLVNNAERGGLTPNKEAIAKLVNTTTGRGTFNSKIMEQAMPLANQVVYSPRLMKAHLDMLNPYTYVRQSNKGVRLEYLRSAAGIAGVTATTNLLLHLAGGKSNMDMNSSDFGKVKFGDTHLDPMAGNQQYMVLMHRLATNHTTNANGKNEKLDSRFGGPSKLGTIETFVRNKLAPVPTAIINTVAGKDGGGNPTNTSLSNNEVVKLFTPMIVQDFADLVKSDPKLLPLLIPGNFGMGLQTYTTQKPKSKGFKMPKVKF